MFDSCALSLYKELITEGSQKLTRFLTREMLKYIGEKHTNNQTTVNPIENIWENIHRDYRDLDLNAHIRRLVGFIGEQIQAVRSLSGSTKSFSRLLKTFSFDNSTKYDRFCH